MKKTPRVLWQGDYFNREGSHMGYGRVVAIDVSGDCHYKVAVEVRHLDCLAMPRWEICTDGVNVYDDVMRSAVIAMALDRDAMAVPEGVPNKGYPDASR